MSLRSSIWAQLAVIPALQGYGLYPDAIPEKETYPAVLFVFENIQGVYTLDGPVNVNDGAISFSVFSYDKTDCVAGIEAVKSVFNGFTGALGDIAIRNVMKVVDEGDNEYSAPDGSSKILFECKVIFSIDYAENEPIWAPPGSPAVPIAYADAPFIIQVPTAGLTGAQALSLLPTGFLYSTTGTGVVTVADPGGGGDVYTNPAPTPAPLGGIPAGETFTARTVQEMFDELLYPYQVPTFSGFSLNYSVLEVGDSTGTMVFTWICTHPENIVAGSLVLTQEFGVPILSGLDPTDSPQSLLDVDTLSTPGTLHWHITGINTDGGSFTAMAAVVWQARTFYGSTTTLDPDNTGIAALAHSNLNAGAAGTYSFPALANSYPTLAWPTSYGIPTSFKDQLTGFGIDLQPRYQVSITNTYGVTTAYNVFQSTNPTSGALTIVVV